MPAVDALSFLQSVSGYTRATTADQSANRPILLGTVDAAYAGPPNLPRITFDGESTLSGKTYPFVGTYTPIPGDRVALAPVGTTYLIFGPVAATSAAVAVRGGSLDITGNATIGGAATIDEMLFVANEGGLPSQPLVAGSTTSTTFVNMPAPASFTFTKKYSAAQTKLRVRIDTSAFVGTANSIARWGVNVNATDYEFVNLWFNSINTHLPANGWTYITGLAAGAWAFQGRWRSPAGISLQTDVNDWIAIHVAEVPV